MFTLALPLLSLVASVLASPQYGYSPPPSGGGSGSNNGGGSSSSSAASAAASAPASTNGHINVQVGAGGALVFSPNNITASNGTVVTFFFPGDIPHSVTQSTFAAPCTPLTAQNGSGPGFDSGLQTNKQFTITITDDFTPIWFHCKQVAHCGLGMVGSINAPATGQNTFQAFQAAAKAIGSNEKTETDNGPVTGGVGAIATATPANTASAGASSSSSSSSSGSSGSSSGASARAGVTGAALLTLVSGAMCLVLLA